MPVMFSMNACRHCICATSAHTSPWQAMRSSCSLMPCSGMHPAPSSGLQVVGVLSSLVPFLVWILCTDNKPLSVWGRVEHHAGRARGHSMGSGRALWSHARFVLRHATALLGSLPGQVGPYPNLAWSQPMICSPHDMCNDGARCGGTPSMQGTCTMC